MNRSTAEITRTYLTRRNESLRANLTLGAPTPAMIEDFQTTQTNVMQIAHKTNRGKLEVAREVGMKVSELEALCIGKRILDIGCGEGKLSAELARLKRTDVTALDVNPVVLSKIRATRNLRVVQGSGTVLPAELQDEKFDVVISSFSSILWAGSPEEKQTALRTALQASEIGGTALLIPIVSNPTYRERNAQSVIKYGTIDGYEELDPFNRLFVLHGLYTSDWMDLQTFDTLTYLESKGLAACTFVPSLENAKGDITQERYSSIVTVLGDVSLAA